MEETLEQIEVQWELEQSKLMLAREMAEMASGPVDLIEISEHVRHSSQSVRAMAAQIRCFAQLLRSETPNGMGQRSQTIDQTLSVSSKSQR